MIYKIFDLTKFIFALIIAKILILLPGFKNVWLITERRAECKDNGYHLFKYLRNEHPEINAFYAIDKDSKQREKIEKYGNVVTFNSFKHYIIALSATKLIGAFLPCGIPQSMCFYKFNKLVKGKICFLQHGITKENIKSLHYENTHLDLFVCGAKPEYDFIKKNYGYNENAIIYSGFCRYDNLENSETENIILVMPTWRQWIPSATWNSKEKINVDDIEYFKLYKELIENDKIANLLNSYGYKLIFYLHHEMQPYIDYFLNENTNIIIASEQDFDVQELLKKSACLVTDYSSVAFDFAYMKKPLIYYQFDEIEYYKNHYSKGYYDYDTMGFGAKCYNIYMVEAELEKIFQNDFKMNDIFEKRVDKFFLYRDKKNCKRNFEAIKNI